MSIRGGGRWFKPILERKKELEQSDSFFVFYLCTCGVHRDFISALSQTVVCGLVTMVVGIAA